MGRKATKQAAQTEVEATDTVDDMPAWQRQSVERSLTSARARAQARSDRFVATTIELMQERGTTDFIVQDVVDRSHMSIKTFYNYFASKDDLLIAVHETIVSGEVVPRLRVLIDKKTDPVQRIHAYIVGLFDLASQGGAVSRALTTYYNRLAETRPAELDRAFKPHIDLVVELVEQAADAGRLASNLNTEKAGHLLHHTVLAAVHAHILGAETNREVSADDLWRFCANGIGVQPEPTKRRS